MKTNTNYLAIVVCALANMALGMTYYGIFAEQWMAGHGLTQETINARTDGATPYLISVVGTLVIAWVISQLWSRMRISGWSEGAIAGAAIGSLGFFGLLIGYAFSLKPLYLGALDGGYAFITNLVYGAILGGWQKKG